MAKRSRKVSTKRPRRSKSSSRKTMKRTKQQHSKKHTLKKPKKVKRKSIRKRKKTKKVMKGGFNIEDQAWYYKDQNVDIDNLLNDEPNNSFFCETFYY